ncbi:hypothetical protein I3843_03G063100 [Carya illinoinensis]|uniref:Large ribosomal subunit protein uL22c n=1 Tax=Carya illinoinensis TaxID=32201 RepID=A0A8T1R1C7_CARIL|nr:50S ribosomal protein L22, chloroplastic-like [Carya illinoinensis]KAG2715082.1 hypothetical protein I3760_03G060200 [Carya illinoinensis]KAG6659891.1 hypothetical protein CIPAW_03G067300 [Carya illinoinensis]KAG6720453.1 hypothetical protein I3842_03G062700 [Carya illinoinensis]KAG7986098.1 hypothetical protein I3843_03G063100 [Carya illinoinensis]
MALSISPPLHSLAFLHQTPQLALPLHRAPSSKTRFRAIRLQAKPNDHIPRKTSWDSKTQKDRVPNRPRATASETTPSEGTVTKDRKQNTYAEAYAIAKHIPMSANKVRRVIDQIRGRSYEESLMILELMPYRACEPVLKLVYSAAANATKNMGLDEGSLIISKAEVNEGVTRKKVRLQARGRAYQIRRRSCHITVVVKDTSL